MGFFKIFGEPFDTILTIGLVVIFVSQFNLFKNPLIVENDAVPQTIKDKIDATTTVEGKPVYSDSAERVTKVVEAYWEESRNIKKVVERLNLSGGHTYRAYCLGRIVEKNKRGDFKV